MRLRYVFVGRPVAVAVTALWMKGRVIGKGRGEEAREPRKKNKSGSHDDVCWLAFEKWGISSYPSGDRSGERGGLQM